MIDPFPCSGIHFPQGWMCAGSHPAFLPWFRGQGGLRMPEPYCKLLCKPLSWWNHVSAFLCPSLGQLSAVFTLFQWHTESLHASLLCLWVCLYMDFHVHIPKYGIFWKGEVTVPWCFAKTHQTVVPINAFLIPVSWWRAIRPLWLQKSHGALFPNSWFYSPYVGAAF